jgi:hypothetical protein
LQIPAVSFGMGPAKLRAFHEPEINAGGEIDREAVKPAWPFVIDHSRSSLAALPSAMTSASHLNSVLGRDGPVQHRFHATGLIDGVVEQRVPYWNAQREHYSPTLIRL